MLFFFLLLGGTIIQFPMYSFLGVKEKLCPKRGVKRQHLCLKRGVKRQIFFSKGVGKGKNLCTSLFIDMSKILHSTPQIRERIPFLFWIWYNPGMTISTQRERQTIVNRLLGVGICMYTVEKVSHPFSKYNERDERKLNICSSFFSIMYISTLTIKTMNYE